MFVLFRYILIALCASVGAYFFVINTLDISSLSADTPKMQTSDNIIEFEMASITNSGILQTAPLQSTGSGKTNFQSEETFPKNQAVKISFGRLADAFVLPTYGEALTHFTDQFKKIDDTSIEIGDIQILFSFYDPFSNYTVLDAKNRYQFEAITNGSVYFGQESDGTISIYSIDSIGEITFFSDGQEMTDMILFPGMYVRFDPSQNNNLKNADILRIVQVLQGLSTGIEFADPRVSTSRDEDAYFMYRLPKNTKILFQMLQVSFQDRVQAANLIKNYALENQEFNPTNQSDWLKNPTKKMHRLLGELQFILSEAVTNNDMKASTLQQKYYQILDDANAIDPENQISQIMEQFLIDGRFELFRKNNNLQFQSIYNAVASIVGVAPTTGKTELFEALSGIFSQNLIEEDLKLTGIHTYLQAAKELKKTLDMGEMDTKDYFDLSLYAYKIFEKMSDTNNRIEKEALEDSEGVVFQMYITILKATQQYIKGLSEIQDQENAQQSLVAEFYEPMMSRLRSSVYGTYVINTDGKLYLRDEIVDRNEAQVSLAFRTYLGEVTDLMDSIYTSQLEPAYQNTNNTQSLSRLKTDIIYLKGFLAMIQTNAYKGYESDPYAAINETTPLPLIEDDTIVRASQKEESLKEDETQENNPVSDISEHQNPGISSQENENVRMVDDIAVTFQKEDGIFSQIAFSVSGVSVSVIGQFNSPEFEIFLLDIPIYASQIASILSNHTSPESVTIIAPQKMILVGNENYYLDR